VTLCRRWPVGCSERSARRGGGVDSERGDPEVRDAFVERMQDDLDTPGATAILFDAIRRANVAFDAREAPRAAELTRGVLECFGPSGSSERRCRIPRPCSSSATAETGHVRSVTSATADALRAEIVALGYAVEDTSSGTRIRR